MRRYYSLPILAILMMSSALALALPTQDLTQSNLDSSQNSLSESVLNSFPPGKPAPEVDVHVDAHQVRGWLKYFDLVVVVDKAANVQHLDAYRMSSSGQIKNVLSAPVSTGTETYGCSTKTDPATGQKKRVKYFAQTPTGYYNPSYLDIDHFSKSYSDGHMAYAVFFIPQLGIATHAHDGGKGMGHRHSHGCVRMTKKTSSSLFEQVMLTGGPAKYQSPFLNARCGNFEPGQSCIPGLKQRDFEARNFVANALIDGADLKDQRPYEQTPMVPVVRRDGSFVPDPQNPDQPLMHPGYRTLYIVKNSHPELDPAIPKHFSCQNGPSESASASQVIGSAAAPQAQHGWNNIFDTDSGYRPAPTRPTTAIGNFFRRLTRATR